MVSSSQRTKSRRNIRDKRKGRASRKERAAKGTSSFPVHPEGYNPKAADAKAS